MPACFSFKDKLPPAEQLSKNEEETSLVPEKANDLKPDILKSGVDITCSTESLPLVIAEETGETIIHESDQEDAAGDVSFVDDKDSRDKTKTGTVAGMIDLSETLVKHV